MSRYLLTDAHRFECLWCHTTQEDVLNFPSTGPPQRMERRKLGNINFPSTSPRNIFREEEWARCDEHGGSVSSLGATKERESVGKAKRWGGGRASTDHAALTDVHQMMLLRRYHSHRIVPAPAIFQQRGRAKERGTHLSETVAAGSSLAKEYRSSGPAASQS